MSSARLFAAALLIAFVACGLPAQDKGKPKDAPAARWEYKVTTLNPSDEEAEKALNKLGEEGWELVTAAGGGASNGARMGSVHKVTTTSPKLEKPKTGWAVRLRE